MTIASGPLQHGYTKAGGGESLPPAVPSPPADLVVRCHCKVRPSFVRWTLTRALVT